VILYIAGVGVRASGYWDAT